MTGVATPLHFGRGYIDSVLSHNGLGEFVGMRPVIEDGMDSSGRDGRWFAGWLIAGTHGYAEVDPDGGVHTTGIWLPDAVIGE